MTARALGAGALLLALSAMRAAAGTYFVDQAHPAASTAGPGTEASPYSTIASAVSARAAAGNTIVVKAGTYREQVTLPASGSALAPIVLRAQGTVIVDGANDFSSPAMWSVGAGGDYLAASVTWSPKQVIVGGTRLTPATDSTSALLLNTFRYVAGAGLYVNVAGANPGASTTYVGRRASAFVVGGRSWITIEGFTSLRADDRAFNLSSGAADLDIVGNTVRYSAKYGMYLSDCHRVRLASNTLSDNGHHGLMLTNATSNCTIEDNEACRNAAPDLRVANGLHLYSATANVIRRNRWHDNQDSGQHLQSGSNDNISSNNISWNNGDHGFDHLGATGTLHLNDVAYGNAKDGFSVEGASTGTRLVNCIAAENGLVTNEFDLWVDTSSLTGFSSNDNLLWNSTSQKPVKLGGTSYALVSAYSAATGQDTRSLQVDPRFIAPANGIFSLRSDSPAIDNGNSSDPNWPATDQQGRARADFDAVANTGLGPVPWSDRGALEYQPGGVPPVAALSASPAMSLAPAIVTLDASGSSDANGTVVSYRFDFGDGTSAGPQPGAVITHTYAGGSFEAIVTVTDDQGLTAQAAAMVFANRAPVAALGVSPAAGRAPLAVQFNASSSFDLDGQVISYVFDFGDGATLGPQASPLATHSYGTGLWHARLRIVDDQGAADTLNTPVAVTVGTPNTPPTAEFTAAPVSGPARLRVTFDASGSFDPDGGVATYEFFFGDGTSSGALTVPQTTHTYSGGQFTARLIVTDVDGATASRSLEVFVTTANLSPNGDILTPAAGAVTVSAGQSVSFTSAASDPDGNLPLSYAWDFGGAGTSIQANPGSVVFPNVGTFFVTLRVWDALLASDPTPDTCRVTVVAPDLSQAADQLHWTMSGPTSVTVDWRGPLGTLSYGLTDAYGTNVNAVTPVPVPWSSTGPFWEARIDGLAVNTTYHYSVAGGTDHTFHTPPARGSSGFTIVAEGDIGSAADYPNVASVQAMVASQNPAFVLAVGDLSYANENGIAACDQFFNDMMAWSTDAAFMPIWGNHEWEKDLLDNLRNYKGRFELPNSQTTPGVPAPNDGGEDWYWFDHGNVRFIAYPEPFSGAWDDWYPRARVLMQDAQADPAIAFVVTFGHRPAYSSGRHPGEERLQSYLDQLGAAFPKYVLNLNGHSHDYERSLPNWGVVHVTAGASGSPLEYSDVPVAGCKWDGGCPAPGWSAYRVMHQGVLRLRFTSGGIEGTYLAGPSTTGEDTTVALGSVLDHFIIGTPAQDQAPVVSVPATADVDEGGLLSLVVSAADADGDAILSLSADLSRLPAGNDAAFTSGPDHTSGVLTWHPTFADAGSHLVTFTASNALAGSAPTTVLVRQKDRPPVVSVPDTAFVVEEGSTLSIEALAEDPDTDAVASLVMHILPEPAGIAPSFQPVPSFSSRISGTLLWVPDFADSGEYRVTFTAANSLAAHREVLVHVVDVDRSPFVIAPAALTLMGAGSLDFTVLASDPDGGSIESLFADLSQLPAGNSAVFSVAADHRSATFHWTPGVSVAGTFTLTFTAANARSGVTSTVLSVNHADHAPVVSAPDTVWVAEGALLRFGVSASDPDSSAIGGLSADLSGLPAGHGAQWNVTPDQRNLTFQWTAGFTHAGTYAVRWTAANALTGMRPTVVRVLQSDRPPIVTAPAAMTGSAGTSVTIDVTAVDPDGDAVASLTADLAGLPAGHSAWFAVASDARSGTFHWTPGAADTGSFPIVFRAANTIAGVATTSLQIARPNSGPTANLSVTASTGTAPLNVTADASASSDAEGPIVSYRFAFGDGTLAGPQASPVVSHVYAPGVWPLSVTVTDQSGAVNTRQVTITVAAAGPGPNLCGNPSFEANTTGWNSFGSASYQRVPGGFSGTSAVELTGTGGTLSSFGLNDGPNWVGATGPLGTRYRFGAWVRSTSSTGMIRLQVREYVNDVKVGASTLSTSFALSPQWQLVWVDHVTQAAGSALDVQVQNSPVSLGETFRVDEVTIHIIPADEPIAGSGDLDPPPEGPKLPGGGAKDDEPGAGATNAFSARVVPAVTRSTAALQFTLIARSTLRVDLFDASGRHVRALLDDAEMAPGLHSLNFDARDDHGDRLASGVYFYRVQAAERSVAGRFVIVR